MTSLSKVSQYGHHFQIQVISSLLTHKDFLVNINDIIDEEYFDNEGQKWIIKTILSHYQQYHSAPTMEVLKVELQKLENEVLQISIKEQLKAAYKASEEDLEYVKEEFSNFCKNQQLKKALLKSVDLLNAGDYDSIRNLVDNALKAGQDKNIGHEYKKDVEDRYQENHRTTIPTPWEQVNEILQGGLGNGDFGLIFGSPGGGKSWSLVALGGMASKLGYNVVHYTLELGEDYVGRRYDSFFTQIPVNEILQNKKKVNNTVDKLEGELVIKEFPPGKATISTIKSHIQKIQELGTTPDLIIIDYVDLLSTRKRTSDRKGEIDDIYTSTKGLARELDLPIWSVSQVNRQGANDDIVEGDKAAGSYDKIMITDFCMSLSRKRKDKVNGTGRFHVMKNRYGIDGITYGAKIDTSMGKFEFHDYDEDMELQPTQPDTNNSQGFNEINSFEKDKLKEKFFKLEN